MAGRETMSCPGKRVAIAPVEDRPGVRDGLEELLRSAGFSAQLFASAQEFFDAVGWDSARDLMLKAREQQTRELQEANAELRQSLAEQQALLKELHHRIKNNLEVVNSLLSLQTAFLKDPHARQILAETCNRIRAIADIHRLLCEAPSFAQVDLGSVVQRIAKTLFAFYGVAGSRVRFALHSDEVQMDVGRAVPFGLIINELFCNALKHAFPGERQGNIFVTIDAVGGTLVFADDGIGLPESLDPRAPPSLGLQLVHMLVEQLRGTLAVDSQAGTRFTVRFSPVATRPKT
jgi:two-component sensor histidine kinase